MGPESRIEIGDQVFVTGELHRTASDNAASAEYRENAVQWLVNDAAVYKADPRVRLQRLGLKTGALFGSISILAAYIALRIVGGHLVEGVQHREYLPGDGGPLHLSNFDRLSIAASLPGAREDALDGLEWALSRHPYRDEASIERQRSLARLRYGSCAGIRLLDPSGRFDEELELARHCGARREVFDIELAKGDFAAARADRPKNLDWPFGDGMIAIALEKWTDAAAAADEIAKRYDAAARRNDSRASSLEQAHRYRCLSQWFHVLAGEPNAVGALRSLASDRGFHPLICAPIAALTFDGEQRVRYLIDALNAPAAEDEHLHEASLARAFLWIEGEDAPYVATAATWGDLAGEESFSTLEFLLGVGAEHWRGKNSVNYVVALEGVALLAIQRGDFPAARAVASDAAAVAKDSTDESTPYFADSLMSVVSLRTGDVGASVLSGGVLDGLRARQGREPRNEMTGYPESCDPVFKRARISAQAGDGRPLATAMQSCITYWIYSPQIVAGLLPLVKQGRAELATALRWWNDEEKGLLHEPFSSAVRAAFRRDTARMIGDNETADRWGRTATAFSVPLQDTTRRVALVLWDQ